MWAWKKSFQKIQQLMLFCDSRKPQKFYRTCFLMTNWPQNRNYSGISKFDPLVTKADADKFFGTFPRVVEELTKQKESEELCQLDEHFVRLLKYVVPHGKKFRGLLLVGSYKMLEKEITDEKNTAANILGWAIELFHTFFVVTDDIVDNSKMRRGVPCWHIKEEVGLNAINDAIYLYEEAFFFLNKYFGKHKNYVRMFELMHEAALKTAKGQVLDIIFTINGKPNFPVFAMSRHKTYCELKTSYYTIYMPILLAMLMTEFPLTEEHNQQILKLSLKLGHFYQIEDDYIDSYGEKIGKSGNDIDEGKCTWLVIKALEKANSEQRKLIEKYYGASDTEATTIIKNLYDELNLPKIYKAYADEFFNDIHADIQRLPKELPSEMFVKIACYCKERDTSYVN